MDSADPVTLRRQMRARREALDPAARLAAADALATVLDALAEIHTDQRVAAYWAVRGELSLHRVVARLLARGAELHLPILRDDRAVPMAFAPYRTGAPVAPNRFGVPEPADDRERALAPHALELVLVPLVAFDRAGHRLGSGAGYYDRSFAFLAEGERPREPLLVGIAYAFQEVEALSPAPWDVRMDFIATDRELIDCGARP